MSTCRRLRYTPRGSGPSTDLAMVMVTESESELELELESDPLSDSARSSDRDQTQCLRDRVPYPDRW